MPVMSAYGEAEKKNPHSLLMWMKIHAVDNPLEEKVAAYCTAKNMLL